MTPTGPSYSVENIGEVPSVGYAGLLGNPAACAGYPSNLISLEEFTIKLYRPMRFKPRGRYNLVTSD